MKKITVVFMAMFAFSLKAATSLDWLGGGWTPVNGTAYLVQMTSPSVPTISQISDYIQSNGLTSSGNYTYTEFYPTTAITNSMDTFNTKITMSSTATNETNLSNFFTIVVSSDNKTFSISDYTSAVGTISTSNEYSNLEVNFDAAWGDISWYDGTVGATAGGDVPEPTVLALLALGVAGVALRRKVA